MRKHLSYLLLITISVIYNSCKKDESTGNQVSARDKVLNEYTANFLGSDVTDAVWTGSTASCDEGGYSADAESKTLQRINYFRRMAGVWDSITFDPVKSTKCQKAALMMLANNTLNHHPPTTWSCYSADGAEAAGKSNLALGANSTDAISLYMQDPGSSNVDLGHRRWLLYSRAGVLGAGSTSASQCLWVIGGNRTPDTLPEFIAWPPKGFVPAPLIYSRWSFAIPNADFSTATLGMTDGSGASVTCKIISNTVTIYGDNTIAWEPSGMKTNSASDEVYHINVANVLVDGIARSYNYDVTIIQPGSR
ncbi:MAG: hypothetical protein HXX13_10135 [Bacteroidetes bacterium]|nr:hypothetical protein [Bacteroidota bacterium]